MADNETYDPRDLLTQPLSNFPDLPTFPPKKTFYGKLIGMTADHANNEKQTPFFHIGIRITDPGKDVPPAFITSLNDAGFSLADIECGTNFYLTKKAMPMLRRFLTTLGFPDTVNFVDALKLNPQTGEPTSESSAVLQGRDVMFTTPEAGNNGRVFMDNVDNVVGVNQR